MEFQSAVDAYHMDEEKDLKTFEEVYDLLTPGFYREEMEFQSAVDAYHMMFFLKIEEEIQREMFFLNRELEIQREVYDLLTTGIYRKEMEFQSAVDAFHMVYDLLTTGCYKEEMKIQSAVDMFFLNRELEIQREDIDDDKSGKSLTLNEEIAFEKQQRFDQNHYPSHGTKFLKRTLSMLIVFLQCAGGTVLGNSQQEHQALSDIYQSTLAEVSNCPTSFDLNERSYNRCGNFCEIHMQDENCAYHCMRDSSKTRLVEFCATTKLLFKYCPEYDSVGQTIQKDEDTLCNSTSSTIYFYSSDISFCDPNGCFQINEPSVSTDATTLTTLSNTKPFVVNSGYINLKKSQQTLCTGFLLFVVMTMYL